MSSPQSKGSEAHNLPPQAAPPAPRGLAVTVLLETWCGEFLSHTGTLYLLPRAAVTEFHKPGSLKEQNYILPQFWKPRNSRCQQGCAVSAGSKGTCFFCLCRWLPSLASLPRIGVSACISLGVFTPASLCVCLPSPSYKDTSHSGLRALPTPGRHLFKNYLFMCIYLAARGLSCGTQGLPSLLWHTGSLVAACGI